MSKKRHEPHEEHADETWLIPYSDLLTLLLALFIVLFASSQLDQKKFAQMAQSFEAAFASPFDSSRNNSLINIAPGSPAVGMTPAEMEAAQLNELKARIEKYASAHNLTKDIEAVITDQGLVLRIKDTALFPSGSADLQPASQQLAAKIASLLVNLPQNIIISGHTDDVPINTAQFPTNWDLSSKRALNFMKFLLAQEPSLKPQNFSALGYGQYRPIAGNDSAEGRAKNRRVEVLIARNYKQN